MSDENESRVERDDDESRAHVIIPFDRLSDDALTGVITEFVTREGTEYGDHDVPLERKIADVRAQLVSGEVVILFHAVSETVNLARAKDVPAR